MKIKDPVSAYTHIGGALLSIIGVIFLLNNAFSIGTTWHIVSFSIFGVTLILLYTTSSIYHTFSFSKLWVTRFRKIDHIMIFFLIAGTYTPICLIPLLGVWGWSLLGSVLGITVAGIVLKILWIDAPRWLSTMVYILMGWLIVIAFFPLIQVVPLSGITWLVIGGALYSIGALFYGLKWPNINTKLFNFHDIFHIFVIGGSASHFWLMYKYIMYL